MDGTFAPFFLDVDGLRLRAAQFPAAQPRALLVLLNGQTEFIEKYGEVIGELAARDYWVVTMDWRGQGGSDRLTADPRKAHIADFSQYDRDLAALMDQVVAPLKAKMPALPLVGLAHSMGGHLLLRRLHDQPGQFDAVALCAPMIGIQPRGAPWWLVEAASRFLNRGGPSQDFVWGMAHRDQLKLPFTAQIVTSDAARYQRTHDILAAHPELRLNGPTWGWLAAALRSILLLHSPHYAETITTPSLIFAAGRDRVCNTEALRAFAGRMPYAECRTIDGAEHEILMERDIYRGQFWSAFDAFMDKKAPRF